MTQHFSPRTTAAFLVGVAALGCYAAFAQSGSLLGVDGNSPVRLFVIDESDASGTVVGQLIDAAPPALPVRSVIGVATSPDGDVYVLNAGSFTSLWRVEPSTGVSTEIGPINPQCPGQLVNPLNGQPDAADLQQYFDWFALGPGASPLIVEIIDRAAPLGEYDMFDIAEYLNDYETGCPRDEVLFYLEGGLAFAPDGTLYAVGAELGFTGSGFMSSRLTTIDTETGFGFAGPPLTYTLSDRVDLNGIAFRSDGVMVGIESQTQTLVTIDTTTGKLTFLADLNGEPGSTGGLAILPNGQGYYATTLTIPLIGAIDGDNSLYSFDPFTGVQQLVSSFDESVFNPGTVRGLSGLTHTP